MPLSPSFLHALLRGRRLLRLRVDLMDTSAVDTTDTPHLLTFHRNQKYVERLQRVRRSADDAKISTEHEQKNMMEVGGRISIGLPPLSNQCFRIFFFNPIKKTAQILE